MLVCNLVFTFLFYDKLVGCLLCGFFMGHYMSTRKRYWGISEIIFLILDFWILIGWLVSRAYFYGSFLVFWLALGCAVGSFSMAFYVFQRLSTLSVRKKGNVIMRHRRKIQSVEGLFNNWNILGTVGFKNATLQDKYTILISPFLFSHPQKTFLMSC